MQLWDTLRGVCGPAATLGFPTQAVVRETYPAEETGHTSQLQCNTNFT